MFRKRRRPTPEFKIPPPYNPVHGENANLRMYGVSPYCTLMQIAEDDIYENYVMCRGFDTRMLRFVDYEKGNKEKPGITVAKPYGKRFLDVYRKSDVYPALLPAQGNEMYVPPSPTEIETRLGQNPGITKDGLDGGQPEDLKDVINLLVDHNGVFVNWLLIDSNEYHCLTGIVSATGVETDPDLLGLKYADVLVIESSNTAIIGKTVRLHDRKGCIFDINVANYCVWAHESWAVTMDTTKECTKLIRYWSADDRCCDPNTAVYRNCGYGY
jgi:hypothetical protein